MRKVTVLLCVAVLALVVSIAYFLQGQASSSTENKFIRVGLIQSGNRSAFWFNLKNTLENQANYTYVVSYNSTDMGFVTECSSIRLPAGQTFYYTNSLTRPSQGVTVINVKIYRGERAIEEALVYEQASIVKGGDIR
mgnify:CR=1 FL=1